MRLLIFYQQILLNLPWTSFHSNHMCDRILPCEPTGASSMNALAWRSFHSPRRQILLCLSGLWGERDRPRFDWRSFHTLHNTSCNLQCRVIWGGCWRSASFWTSFHTVHSWMAALTQKRWVVICNQNPKSPWECLKSTWSSMCLFLLNSLQFDRVIISPVLEWQQWRHLGQWGQS